jgi:hypothetical protein
MGFQIMEIEFFRGQIKRLRTNYGSTSYPQETAKAIWDAVKHVKQDRFEKAITRCLADSPKYPFGISKIEVTLADIREERHRVEKIERNNNAPSIDEISKYCKDLLSKI